MTTPKPQSVITAKRLGDFAALSRLGRYGAVVKREIKEKDKERRMFKRLAGSRQMRLDAHEDICPVND